MCMCTCCGGRDCCSPIIPQTAKAKNYRVALLVITILHLVLLCVKIYFMGLFSGISDLLAIVILIVALVRYDYCFIMFYIVINLFEIFALIVVLGYYLQTDMGKNVPKHGLEQPSPDDGDKAQGEAPKVPHSINRPGGQDPDANQSNIFGHIKHALNNHQGKQTGMNLVFRDLFNEILKKKYSFHQQRTVQPNDNKVQNQFAKQASAGSALMQQDSQINLESDDDGSKQSQKLSDLHGPVFIITFCSVIILFYLVAAFIAHYAYREYKGLAEDCAGGSVNFKDGNILYYGIIDKREDDAIAERVEQLKRERARNNNSAAGGNQDDQQPLIDPDNNDVV